VVEDVHRIEGDRILAMRLLSTTLALLLVGTAMAEKHPFGADDWAGLKGAQPVAVSPTGQVLYQVFHGGASGPDTVEWKLTNLAGGGKRDLDLPEGFRPSGFTHSGDALYGTYSVNKMPQVATFPLADLKASSVPSRIILLPSGVGPVSISPDGKRFAILANPLPPGELDSVRTVIEPSQTSIYVVNVDGSEGKWWAPSLINVNSIAWSPDGRSLAVSSMTPKIGFHYVKSQIDVVTETGPSRVAEIDNAASGIAWAGDDLAFLSTTTSVLTPDHLWTVPAKGGKPVDRTHDLKGSAVGLAGDAQGRVWVEVHRGVIPEINRFEGGSLKPAYRMENGVVRMPVTSESSSNDDFVFGTADPEHSVNVATLSGGKIKRLTGEGDDFIKNIDLGSTKIIHWKSKEGIDLEGIVSFPPGFKEGKKYPFLVLPHGGPEGNDEMSFGGFAAIFTGLGYVVIEPQYRGSTGYGSAFLDSIYQHFGDRAYRDVDSATDYAVAQGWADPNRLAIMGWSAGGFMTSWTITQTHRYKAAIEGAGITDWGSFIWTSDVQQIDYDARWPGKEPQFFTDFSAVMYADQVTTPLLILHGDADQRVPTFQGREYFEALVAQGKVARMVTYPGSGHFPRVWEQRRDLVREMAAWLKKYNP
jgi:dipeptidyl aminopeptidase/acylaminoacyl peptidase